MTMKTPRRAVVNGGAQIPTHMKKEKSRINPRDLTNTSLENPDTTPHSPTTPPHTMIHTRITPVQECTPIQILRLGSRFLTLWLMMRELRSGRAFMGNLSMYIHPLSRERKEEQRGEENWNR